MKTKKGLDARMKSYEKIPKNFLTERLPVIVRIDGKAFHTFTKGFNKPFDTILQETMIKTCEYLCANIMGCKLAYTQSDEISLLLINYESIDSSSWFNNNVQKISSVAASMATMAFNYYFEKIIQQKYNCNDFPALPYWGDSIDKEDKDDIGYFKLATFDARCFVLPKEEVCNYFIWRQEDATKNSIQMVAQSQFKQKELQSLNSNQLQEKLWQERNINWNNFPIPQKRGTCIKREEYTKNNAIRHKWCADLQIPIFSQNREYIENFVFI